MPGHVQSGQIPVWMGVFRVGHGGAEVSEMSVGLVADASRACGVLGLRFSMAGHSPGRRAKQSQFREGSACETKPICGRLNAA
jgi:hypothetical protein